jgi:DNA-binding transcriptional MerR regulator
VPTVTIPNRPVFRAQEVCDLVEVQAYVLRSWEAEFPDLGVAKTPNGPRVYRRADVERVIRIKHLLFEDGLTLAGARRRLSEEGLVTAAEPVQDADVAAMIDDETRQHLRDVRRGLTWILGVLSGNAASAEDFVLTAEPSRARSGSAGGRAASGSTRPAGGSAKDRATSPARATASRTARPHQGPRVGGKKR